MAEKDSAAPRKNSRRQFLQTGVAVVAATALTRPAAGDGHEPKSKPGGTDVDVIVVGAGYAGVTAARELSHAGYSVLLLEARNRLGGRTFTTQFAGKKIELGGMWVHWTQPFIWSEMHRYGHGVVESPVGEPTRGIVVRQDGSREEHDVMELYVGVMDAFNAMYEDAIVYFPRPYDPLFRDSVKAIDGESVADRMASVDIPPHIADMMTGMFGGLVGLPMDQASSTAVMKAFACSGWSFVPFLDAQARYKIEGGTIGLIESMLNDSEAEVRLATPVAAAEQKGDTVRITTADDEVISTRAAVFTIPRNVYKTIDFSPGLPEDKMNAIDGNHQGRGFKVYAHVRQDIGQILAAGAVNNPFGFMQTERHGPDGSILIAFGGDRDNLDVNDDAAVAAAIGQYLPEVDVLATTTYDWLYDPYSMGAWPAYSTDDMTTHVLPMQRPEGRLFFAGAGTANGWHVWIDGAVESGIRAGRQVREALD